MAQTIFSGSQGAVYVGDHAVASIRSFSIEETQETIDATSMNTAGVSFRTSKATFKSWSGTISVYWTANTTATSLDGYGNTDAETYVENGMSWTTSAPTLDNTNAVSDDDVFGPLAPGSSEVTLHFWPSGDDKGELGYEGNCLVTGRTISSSVDGMVEAEITVTGTSALKTEISEWTGLTGA